LGQVGEGEGSVSRRRFIASSTALAAGALWVPAARAAARSRAGPAERLEGFPHGVAVRQERFENWSQTIEVDRVWTCAPREPGEVVDVVNWAWRHGYRVRARGAMHNWSPLTLAAGSPNLPRVVLVDTTQHLTRMRLSRSGPAAVTTESGATMDALLTFLERAGRGLVAHPAPGGLTVGGVLAVDGHGTAIPASGEPRPGDTFGSVSNLVLSLTAVVWSTRHRRYVLRTFARDHPACGGLLTHLGRALVTQVTLRTGSLRYLRCVSHVDIPARELFAAPGVEGRTFASFVEQTGRAEAILYPFTDRPWLKVWSVSPERPVGSREVQAPYNYPFSDTLSAGLQHELRDRVVSHPGDAVTFGNLSYDQTAHGLGVDRAYDIWGAAKDVLLYVRPSTLRVTANGYAVLTRRRDIQRVVSDFVAYYERVVARYRAQNLYPMNMPVEIRVTGLDHAADAGVLAAQPALLSALSPRADHPEWDVAVWLDILSFPGTPAANRAYREIERWMFAHFRAPYATVRPEWSKGWAYTTNAAWSDRSMIASTIPRAYRIGRQPRFTWDAAISALHGLDPHGVFTSPLLESLLRLRPGR
jgi:FAD/FMN-containing dehydrogenase